MFKGEVNSEGQSREPNKELEQKKYMQFFEIAPNLGGLKDYDIEKKVNLESYEGEVIGHVYQVPGVLLYSNKLRNYRERGQENLEDYSINDMIRVVKNAGKSFDKEIDGVNYEDYLTAVTLATGIPISDTRKAGDLLQAGMTNMDEIIKAHTPNGDISVYDDVDVMKKPRDKKGFNRNYLYVPKGNTLGINLPGNHPAVNILGIEALTLLKSPTYIRPSNKEPLTPSRVVDSINKSGLDQYSLYLLPGDSQEVGDAILNECDLNIVFGGENVKRKYESHPNTKVYGPGNSKIFIDEDYSVNGDAFDIVKEALITDGGKGCINPTQIIVKGNAKRFADYLAEELASIEVMNPLEKEAQIPAVKPREGKMLNDFIENNLNGAEDLTSKYRERLLEKDGITYLGPTIIYIEENPTKHPLYTELPFQYGVVANYEKGALDDTLALTMMTDDRKMIDDVIKNPSINKIYDKIPSTDIDITEPHQGFLSDELYEKKTFRASNKKFSKKTIFQRRRRKE